MIGYPFSLSLPYNYSAKQYRVLYHETLQEYFIYLPPRETINFDVYPIFKPTVKTETTLSSTIATRFTPNIQDAIVTEKWYADDLSIQTGLFHQFLRFFMNPVNPGENIIWYPKDQTDIAYQINIVDLIVGSTEEMSYRTASSLTDKNYRFLRSEPSFKFQILETENIPEAIAIMDSI